MSYMIGSHYYLLYLSFLPSCSATVAVFGLGGVGLSVIQGAALSEASRIIAVDTNPEKWELAKSMVRKGRREERGEGRGGSSQNSLNGC